MHPFRGSICVECEAVAIGRVGGVHPVSHAGAVFSLSKLTIKIHVNDNMIIEVLP